MKDVSVETLAIPEIKVFKFGGFRDERGYFSETFKTRQIAEIEGLELLAQRPILQVNQSYSEKNVLRGLHFQWNPFMGKLVRTVHGHMIDIVVDIRIGSPTWGKGIMYDMPAKMSESEMQWIWVPPGFAHGNYFREETIIEYFCTGDYSEGNEAGVSPLADDIDWSLCDKDLIYYFAQMPKEEWKMTDKDRHGWSIEEWEQKIIVEKFHYGTCEKG
jgi:dTDP-4-dehydrorhamnose 3,5-epimerase